MGALAPGRVGRYLEGMRLALIFLVALAFELEAQQPPKPVWLTWPDLKIVAAPDTTGETVLWITADSAMAGERGGRFFFGALDPRATQDWVRSVRAFLKQDLTARDTGETRNSSVLHAKSGQRLYFLRRRYDGKWTHERFLVFTDSAGNAPALLAMDVRVRDVLDALESAARRTHRRPEG